MQSSVAAEESKREPRINIQILSDLFKRNTYYLPPTPTAQQEWRYTNSTAGLYKTNPLFADKSTR